MYSLNGKEVVNFVEEIKNGIDNRNCMRKSPDIVNNTETGVYNQFDINCK